MGDYERLVDVLSTGLQSVGLSIDDVAQQVADLGDVETRAALIAWEQSLAMLALAGRSVATASDTQLDGYARAAWKAGRAFARAADWEEPTTATTDAQDADVCDLSIDFSKLGKDGA